MDLKPTERCLLDFLRANSGRIIGRDELSAKVWQRKMIPQSRTVDQTIANLRRKLQNGEIIITHARQGYEYRREHVTVDYGASSR